MPDGRVLHIVNDVPEHKMSATVVNEPYCCDNPAQSETVSGIAFGTHGDLYYCKRGGHGCDGHQGSFRLQCMIDSTVIGEIDLNFDSDGNMSTPSVNSGKIRMAFDPAQNLLYVGQ